MTTWGRANGLSPAIFNERKDIMNFFEKEFRKMFWGNDTIGSPFYVDGVCFGTLGRDHLVQLEFVGSSGDKSPRDILKTVVAHRMGGELHTIEISLKDIFGDKVIRNVFRETDKWYWIEESSWNIYYPTWEDRRRLRDAVVSQLEGYCKKVEPSPRRKMVYTCAPLRGDVERNIEFARQRARGVFLAGDIPVCPHLMFPPIADPGDSDEDQAARKMGLQLVALCQQVNVYGSMRTPGMLEEISLAEKLRIPVKYFENADIRLPRSPK